jgi:hypothetical protein
MQEDNTPKNLRAGVALRWRSVASRRPWLLPLCAGLAVGLVVLPLIGILWLSREAPPSASAVTAGLAAESPPPAAPLAEPPGIPRTIFLWRDDQGVLRRTAVDSARYDEFVAAEQRQIDEDQRAMAAARSSRLRTGLAPIFAEIDERVPGYADWVFDWWTSWILLARTFRWTWDDFVTGPPFELPDRVQAQLVSEVREQFIGRVLEPQTLEPSFETMLDASLAAWREDLATGCGKYQRALTQFVRREATQVERRDPAQGWVPDPAWDHAAAGFHPLCDPAEVVGEAALRPELPRLFELTAADSPINDVILRLARPFATKLISFLVLPIVVAALLGGVLLPLFGLLPNVLANVVTGIVTGAAGALVIGFVASTAVDWVLSRTDAALNRAGFEASVHKAVGAAEQDFASRVLDLQQRSTERQWQAMATALTGKVAIP